VVRATHNRRIEQDEGGRGKLFDFARGLPAAGRRTRAIPATAGRPARTAVLAVAFAAVTLVVPVQPRGEVRGEPLAVWVLRVGEVGPPAGVEPLEWVLLTDQPVAAAAGAWERVDWYECRWQVEEFHKGLKTGCGVEQVQFTTAAALEPAIAVLSVLAAQLLQLRDAARDPAQSGQPARRWVGALAVKVVSLWRHRRERPDWTVGDSCRALARLGGHQNRKGDGPPGWLTLWRGTMKLQPMLAIAALLDDQPPHERSG
jgi:hypothetical protein